MKIGVLTPVQQSQYLTSEVIIPKKEGTVCFIMDYRRLNQKLIRNLYPLPRIGKTMQQLEVLQYVAVLDLNMRYYTIRFSPGRQYMTVIVIEFGKFRYNRLPMGMCASAYISQAKVDELLGDIEDIKTYIDDILVLNK